MSISFFTGFKEYDHSRSARIGVLLANLGTPDAPTAAALKPYLRQFLSDPRIIEIPPIRWQLILNLFILPFRPKRSAELYSKVWTEQGSPLLVNTEKQKEALQSLLDTYRQGEYVVEIGMRIGRPSIEQGLEKLRLANVQRLFILPMYPQYSSTTTGSVFDAVADTLKTWRFIPELRMLNTYHDKEGYITCLVNTIKEKWKDSGQPEKLLFSYHGIPKRYFENGDPYFCFCQKTSRLVAESLKLDKSQYVVAFQSLFGKEEWIRPYTNETLEALAKAGTKSVDVICPGFSVDCLETLEEIEEENKEVFLHNGGERYGYIHALNDRVDHMEFLADLVKEQTRDWGSKGQEGKQQGEKVENYQQFGGAK